MQKKLFVIHDVIYPDIDGGKKIVLGRILHDVNFFQVDVLLFNYNNVSCDELKVFFEKKGVNLIVCQPSLRKIEKIRSLISFRPYYENMFSLDKGFKAQYENIVALNEYDRVSFESIFFYNFFYSTNKSSCNRIVNFLLHNVESNFFLELSKSTKNFFYKLFFFLESLKIKNLEKKASNSKELIFTFLTESDLQEYKNLRFFVNSKNYINHNEIYTSKYVVRNEEPEVKFFLFPGSVSFPPNYYALDKFLEFYEDSALQIPVYVTGSNKFECDFTSRYKKVKFTGYISEEELCYLYSNCIAAISPILTGSGVKVKNLEVLKLGVPLVATKFSMIGIKINSSDTVCVTENRPSDFVKCLLSRYL